MDVGEEVVVGEVVVGDRIVRDEAASSRAERSPKTLSPFSRTGLKRCGFGGLLSRPAVHAASRDGEDRSSNAVLRNFVARGRGSSGVSLWRGATSLI